jgi:NitT/TauT family transport system substrate-binding protein
VVRAVNQGAPSKAIVDNVGTPPYSFMAQPNIKNWSDLKGKTISIGGSKDITLIFFEAMAKPNGLTNKEDYTLTYAGATSDRYAALKSGSVAAAILFPPFNFLAQSEGYTDLGEVEQYLPEFPFDFWDGNTSWLSSHKDLATKFVKADLNAIKWLYDPANKDEAVKILTEVSNTKPDAAAQTYDLFFQKLKNTYPKDGRFSEAGLQQVLNALVELGDMSAPLPPVSKYIDETYVKAAAGS